MHKLLLQGQLRFHPVLLNTFISQKSSSCALQASFSKLFAGRRGRVEQEGDDGDTRAVLGQLRPAGNHPTPDLNH